MFDQMIRLNTTARAANHPDQQLQIERQNVAPYQATGLDLTTARSSATTLSTLPRGY